MEKNIKDYLPYYTGQFLHVESYGTYKLVAYDQMQELYGIKHGTKAIWHPITNEFKLILRKLESMTKDEMIELLLSMCPPDMKDKPTPEDHDLDMFYNDGGNMVDGNVAVGANYTCICYEGQIAIRYNGDIHLFDEAGDHEMVVNQTAAFHYLVSKGFDLFNLINSGVAIEKQPTTQKENRST